MTKRTGTHLSVIKGNPLGKGYEGKVFAARVEFRSGQRVHKREMAIKAFRRRTINAFPASRELEMHLLVYAHLRKLNREKKSGIESLADMEKGNTS